MKVSFLQIHEAFNRAVMGEPVSAIARSLGVTEGCLRYHFSKGTPPKEVRRVAFEIFRARHAYDLLSKGGRRIVDGLVAKTNIATWLSVKAGG